ncbi:T9SS type A sorting domain-containing protein [Xanthomarina spongicola]|uniref:Putative secreted protein (Por secretion system target) n=1 Tax=Xanthomarina spongicola TaxID=570520 RepID=A0A316DS54_9FLAO|nr:T9SS type A sorting domain-containing protein [Xanthomarina spongicola]PWK19513.1 putative secreted protein (Por secretion system target) [Xanthomarina spongicola]
MKKITLLFFTIIAFAFSFQANAQCNYTLEMNDSYGDGWNGNTMDVLVNGTAVLTGVTLADGSQGTMAFTVNDGDDVTTNWIGGGSYAYETSYRILNSVGGEVGAGAETSITTGTITASCPTCTQVVSNSETVIPDCGNSQFSVDVDVATVGDGTFITDGLGGSFAIVNGIVTAGPYATSSTVTLTVEHSDGACDYSLGDFSYDLCPSIVICGTPTNSTYCYNDYDTTMFAYQSSDGSVLKVTFNAGGIESCCDDLVILDSDGVTELYRGANGGDLTGVTATATGDTIYVGVDSDVSSSCDSGAQTPQWDWDVVCLACTSGEATATVIENCGASTYTIQVDVTTVGDATDITDGTTTLPFTGTQTFGPYAFGVNTTLDVVHSDSACDFALGTYTFAACPPANDDCANAEALIPSATAAIVWVTGTTSGNTASGEVADVDVSCGSFGSGRDTWYSVEVPASGEITIETQASTGSSLTDTTVSVFSGTCGAMAGTEIACNDDGGTGAFSLIALTGQTAGAILYVRVQEYGAAAARGPQDGPFEIAAYATDPTLSTQNFDKGLAFTYYPNPVNNSLSLRGLNTIQNVAIYNMLGQEVLRTAPNTVDSNIDMSNLQPGTYFVQVMVENATKTIKVIKK